MNESSAIKRCPICRSKAVRRITGDLTFKRGSKTYRIPGIERDRCQHCKEEFFGKEANRRIDAYLSRHKRAAA